MHLHDVVECCDAIEQYVSGRTFDEYKSQRGFRAQVEREFITIGEAIHRRSVKNHSWQIA